MKNIEKLIQIMAKLRDKDNGCPWDIEQDFMSIVPHTIEEAYEVADAIEKNDMISLKSELGDLLLQVIFYCQMAGEEKQFNFYDVVEQLNNKLIKRHPHVFGTENIENAGQQEVAWEKQKELERAQKAVKEGKNIGLLDDIALALPALTRSVKLQKRAAKVGFDWPDIKGVIDKITEELSELKDSVEENSNIEEEIGDLLFSITNLARKLNIDPEIALKECNKKFERRFAFIEKELANQNIDIKDATLEQMDDIWNKVRKQDKKTGR